MAAQGALLASPLMLGATLAHAFDPTSTFKPADEPHIVLRYGFKAWKEGRMDHALGAFRYGAERNDLASQWKLARMLQQGVNGERNEMGAFELYERIARRYQEAPPARRDRPFVSHAVTMLGIYSLAGIPGTRIKSNPWRAENYFYRAAALYKDPEAQYRLGSLYASEHLGAKRPTHAARWLGLAARKGHPMAQAKLGEMLFYGRGLKRKPVRGLVYLARAAKSGLDSAIEAQRVATEEATEEQLQQADTLIAQLSPSTSLGTVASIQATGGTARAAAVGN